LARAAHINRKGTPNANGPAIASSACARQISHGGQNERAMPERLFGMIPYMGTKRHLAPEVARLVSTCRAGPMLDAFGGMGAVGAAVATSRQVWVNDIQVFAHWVGKAEFTSQTAPFSASAAAGMVEAKFEAIHQAIQAPLGAAIKLESEGLYSESLAGYLKMQEGIPDIIKLNASKTDIFSFYYSNNYFGIAQAIEIDALRQSFFILEMAGLITEDSMRWMVIALGRAMLRVSNSPGHFAQFLKAKQTNFKRLQRQRRRSVWAEWLIAMSELRPIASSEWRSKNRSYNDEAENLIRSMRGSSERPAVIYLDPPYTDDQYSRFYHLFETLALYELGEPTGAGIYRGDRFTADFSLKSKVTSAFKRILEVCREVGADVVVSYPTNGLLKQVGGDAPSIISEVYGNVQLGFSSDYAHSTFGASKGVAKSSAVENIYMAAA
jgi:adenine-specific DNA-methyltransferase